MVKMLKRFLPVTFTLAIIYSLFMFSNFFFYLSTTNSVSKYFFKKSPNEFEQHKYEKTGVNSVKDKNYNHYIKRYPFMLDCKNEYNKLDPFLLSNQSFINTTLNNNYDYRTPAPNQTHSIRIVKGVLIYFPIAKIGDFESEFKWLYRSWLHMQKYEPPKWRTDLIVFVDRDKNFEKPDLFFNQLNCSFKNIRSKPTDAPMCTLINYKAVKERHDQVLNGSNFGPDKSKLLEYLINDVYIYKNDAYDMNIFYKFLRDGLSNYGYLDSILMAFDGYDYFKQAGFDFLIRSDMDVFLTPLLAYWLPRHCNDFYTGGGAYSNIFNSKRFRRIAKDLNLKYANRNNLGSTWISTPEQFRVVSYLTLICMAYLAKEEFTQPEREGQVGTINWPEWHYGVLLLYGQHLAMNHLIGSNQLNVVTLPNLIDFPSGNTESIFKMLHIHVFHGDDLFSKFVFKMGRYDNLTVSDDKMQQVKYFALKMALDSKKYSNNDTIKIFKKIIDGKI